MTFFKREGATQTHRDHVRTLLPGLESISPTSSGRIVEAWARMWASSSFSVLETVPVSPGASRSLVEHTNDVVHLGRALASAYEALSVLSFDRQVLDEILFLHDIDKLVLFEPSDEGVTRGPISKQVPHGVVAGMLLHEMGFDNRVVSVVTTHATDAPFHNGCAEALILHYADMAAIDYIRLRDGQTPFFQIK
jgi:hypothetical protein